VANSPADFSEQRYVARIDSVEEIRNKPQGYEDFALRYS
jgi:hypothetical protein